MLGRHAMKVRASTPRPCRRGGGNHGGYTSCQHIAVRRGERCCERDCSRLRGRQVNGDDLTAQRGDGLALILHAAYGITYDASRIVDVQQALVVSIIGMTRHSDIQVSEWLVGHTHVLPGTHRHHLLVGQLLCLLVFTLEDKFSHLRQRLTGLGVQHLIGLPSPDGLLVQLYALHGGRTEHHAAHRAIANGQRLRPRLRRTAVPQMMLASYGIDGGHQHHK